MKILKIPYKASLERRMRGNSINLFSSELEEAGFNLDRPISVYHSIHKREVSFEQKEEVKEETSIQKKPKTLYELFSSIDYATLYIDGGEFELWICGANKACYRGKDILEVMTQAVEGGDIEYNNKRRCSKISSSKSLNNS